MEIIKSKKHHHYSVAFTDYGLCVVSETNSWPVTIIDSTHWTCEHHSLPEYVKKWLYQIAKNWDKIKKVPTYIGNLISAINNCNYADAKYLYDFIVKYGSKNQIKKANYIIDKL